MHDYQIVPIAAPGEAEPEDGGGFSPRPAGFPDRAASRRRLAARREHARLGAHLHARGRSNGTSPLPDRVHQLIIEHFGVGSGSLEDSGEDFAPVQNPQGADEVVDEDAAVVRFVSDVISQAIADAATDIHFEPQEGQLRIRYRVDGLLVPVPLPENLLRFQDAIISRLKIMARLNISERRLPQDGRINFKTDGNTLDIRVSTIPTIYAESVSLRLLNQKKEAFTMDRLGMNAEEQARSSAGPRLPARHHPRHRARPVPARSTSLNAFLRQINSPDLRIVTIEDPIEYEVPGVNQMQVRPEIGLTFASALRHVLRQDPDVIMVGEIRDLDTAEIAIRASLTGHLVFSTHPHQRRRRRLHAPGRHGRGAVPRGLGHRAGDRPAPRAPALPRLRPAAAGQPDQAARHAGHPRTRSRRGRLRHRRSWRRSAATAAATAATADASASSRFSARTTSCTTSSSSARSARVLDEVRPRPRHAAPSSIPAGRR